MKNGILIRYIIGSCPPQYKAKVNVTYNQKSDSIIVVKVIGEEGVENHFRMISMDTLYFSQGDESKMLFALIRFKSYGKEYVYGGWKYNFDTYWDFKKAFDDADSHGGFFHENIKPATINCSG